MALELETTIGVIVLFMVMSILYKNNIFFRIGSMMMVAASLGYQFPTAMDNIYYRNIVPISQGNLYYVLPVILGALLFTTFYKKTAFMGRFPSAITIGTGLGAATSGAIVASIYKQLVTTATITSSWGLIESALVVLIMIYFLQTPKRSGAMKTAYSLGYWALILFFGAGLGSYAIARFSQAIGRIEYVLLTWLGL